MFNLYFEDTDEDLRDYPGKPGMARFSACPPWSIRVRNNFGDEPLSDAIRPLGREGFRMGATKDSSDDGRPDYGADC